MSTLKIALFALSLITASLRADDRQEIKDLNVDLSHTALQAIVPRTAAEDSKKAKEVDHKFQWLEEFTQENRRLYYLLTEAKPAVHLLWRYRQAMRRECTGEGFYSAMWFGIFLDESIKALADDLDKDQVNNKTAGELLTLVNHIDAFLTLKAKTQNKGEHFKSDAELVEHVTALRSQMEKLERFGKPEQTAREASDKREKALANARAWLTSNKSKEKPCDFELPKQP